MSEISRAAPSAPKPTATQPHRGPAGKPNEERGDAFSALMSLVADTQATPMGEASTGDAGAPSNEAEPEAKDTTQDNSNNPVAQLLAWADPRSTAGGTTPTGPTEPTPAKPPAGAAAATATATATAATNMAADAAKTGDGVSIAGMQPLATPEAIDPAALPPGAHPAAGNTAGAAPDAVTSSTQPGAKTTVAATVLPAGANTSSTQPLTTPEAINPAALPPGTHPAAARTGGAAAALGDARDARPSGTARRDGKSNPPADATVALRTPPAAWQPLTNASARGTATAAGGGDALRGRGVTWANSTVSMDLSATRDTDSVAGNAVSLTARLSAMLAGQTQPDGAAPTPLLGATQDAGANPAETPSPTDLLTGAEAALEPEPEQISHWSTQHLRHAHLRLGEGAQDSVDIRLSMQGQDLSVDFRTDNADIRQSLAQQANQSLATLLERSGIALADVSVGAQQQQRQGQGGEPQGGGASAQLGRGAASRGEADPSAAVRTPAAQPLRADGSRPLDLFV